MEAPEGFLFVADFLSAAEQSALLRELVALTYEHDTFRGQRLTGTVDPKQSPVASLVVPEQIRSVLWTAGELHFLATPLREKFPELHAISKRFAKWLHEFECVFESPGKQGAFDYYLEGSLRNFDPPIFALPEAFAALRGGQYFVSHGSTPESVELLCGSLRLRGVNCGPADA